MRARRQFSDEYKAEVVQLIIGEGRSVGKVCKELDLTESSVRRWVSDAQAERSSDGTGVLKKEERDELRQLRREVRQLRMEREILKKATAFFAKESS